MLISNIFLMVNPLPEEMIQFWRFAYVFQMGGSTTDYHGNPQPSFFAVITHILGGGKTFIFHGFGVQGLASFLGPNSEGDAADFSGNVIADCGPCQEGVWFFRVGRVFGGGFPTSMGVVVVIPPSFFLKVPLKMKKRRPSAL